MDVSYLISLGLGSPASVTYMVTFGLTPAVVTSMPIPLTLDGNRDFTLSLAAARDFTLTLLER